MSSAKGDLLTIFVAQPGQIAVSGLPSLDKIEGVTQPQGAQHEQQAQDGDLSGANHQRLGQEDGDVPLSVVHCQGPAGIVKARRLVIHLLQNLCDLVKDYCAVLSCQRGFMEEVFEN